MSEQTTEPDAPELVEHDHVPKKTSAKKSAAKKAEPKPLGKLPDGSYAFEVGKTRHVLPEVTDEILERVPGHVLMDAYVAGDADGGDMRMKFGLLAAVRQDAPVAVAALRGMPSGTMNEHLNEWLGESDGSSD